MTANTLTPPPTGCLVHKDETISLTRQVFLFQGNYTLSLSAIVGFSLTRPGVLLTEGEFLKNMLSALPDKEILDVGMPKTQGELLAAATCHAPNGKTSSLAGIRVGDVFKRVLVRGPRRWQSTLMGVKISPPEPFTNMPLTWENAFGGQEYEANPVGRGFIPRGEAAGKDAPLPRVEDPEKPISHPEDTPEPQSFAPMGVDWPGRVKNLGTFDQNWLQNVWPGLPADFDWSSFNRATPDLRCQGFFHGDENVECENLHPTIPLLESRLPGVRARLFVGKRSEAHTEEKFETLEANLDTVWLFPEQEFGAVIFRASTHVIDDEAQNLSRILAYYEPLEESREAQWYFDRALKSKHKAPPPISASAAQAPELPPEEDKTEPPSTSIAKAEADIASAEQRLAKHDARLEELCRQAGVDPAQFSPPEEKPAFVSPDIPRDQLLAHCQDQLHQLDNKLLDLARKSGGPTAPPEIPKLDTKKLLSALGSMSGVDHSSIEQVKSLLRETQENKARLKALKEKIAQQKEQEPVPQAPEPSQAPDALTRERVLVRHKLGQSFAGRNLSGMDLSHADLHGIDLRDAILENTNLSYTNLRGAQLKNAVLTGADMSHADLSEANAKQASLVQAKLENAKLINTDLTLADLSKANATEAKFEEAYLDNAQCENALFIKARCEKLRARQAWFTKADLTDAVFHKSDLAEARLHEATLNNVDFTGARMENVRFDDATGAHMNCTHALLRASRASGTTNLPNADFSHADLTGSYWEQAGLEAAVFRKATLHSATFTDCYLQHAEMHNILARACNLAKSDLQHARVTGADLLLGSLRKARIEHVDFSAANLFGVDFFGTWLHNTVFDNADIQRTLLQTWRPQAQDQAQDKDK